MEVKEKEKLTELEHLDRRLYDEKIYDYRLSYNDIIEINSLIMIAQQHFLEKRPLDYDKCMKKSYRVISTLKNLIKHYKPASSSFESTFSSETYAPRAASDAALAMSEHYADIAM